MKTITPRFPNQSSIDAALSKLSEEEKNKYNALQEQYNTEIQRPEPNHELIKSLITQANEMLKLLRDAKSENFVSHWGYGIQYPKCSIETKSVQRRIVDISALFSNIIQKRNSQRIIFGTQFS